MRNTTCLLMIFAISMLTACASGGTPMPGLMLPPPQTAMAPCPPLPPPLSGKPMDLLSNHIEVAKLYHQCRDRHQALINWMEATDALR